MRLKEHHYTTAGECAALQAWWECCFIFSRVVFYVDKMREQSASTCGLVRVYDVSTKPAHRAKYGAIFLMRARVRADRPTPRGLPVKDVQNPRRPTELTRPTPDMWMVQRGTATLV